MKTLYFDTNVILAEMAGKPPSVQAFNLMTQRSASGVWYVCTSGFALMEAFWRIRANEYAKRLILGSTFVETNEFRNMASGRVKFSLKDSMNAENKVNAWLNAHASVVKVHPITPPPTITGPFDFSEYPYRIMSRSGLHFEDAIHLTSALLVNAEILVTNDSGFRDTVRQAVTNTADPLNRVLKKIVRDVTGSQQPLSLATHLQILDCTELLRRARIRAI